MQNNWFFRILLLGLALALGACAAAGRENAKEEKMGETLRSEAGGFELTALDGYETHQAGETIEMFLPGGDLQSGPGLIVSGLRFEQDVTLQQAEAVIRKTYTAYEFGKAKPYRLDKIKGLALDFSTVYRAPDGVVMPNPGAAEGEEIRGRVVVVMVTPRQQLRCLLLAPTSQWNTARSRLEKVLKSLVVFEVP